MSPGTATGRPRDACNDALSRAVGNAVGGSAGGSSNEEQGRSNDVLAVLGAGPSSPKGTGMGTALNTAAVSVSQGGTAGGSPRAQVSGKGRETDATEENLAAIGLTVQRMETVQTSEDASPKADEVEPAAVEPVEPSDWQGEGGADTKQFHGLHIAYCQITLQGEEEMPAVEGECDVEEA